MKISDEKFELIITSYHKLLFSIAYSYIRSNYYAEDIVQDAFIKLYRARKHFESDEHIKNYLIRVTIDECLDVLRHDKKIILTDTEYFDNLTDVNTSNEKNEDIYGCICSLNDSYKNIIILYYYDNYSLKEIANILKISESNASTRLVRARDKLKKVVLERRKHNE